GDAAASAGLTKANAQESSGLSIPASPGAFPKDQGFPPESASKEGSAHERHFDRMRGNAQRKKTEID
ncbi:unnamed protein product, partial [Amoebophrya sp. A25]